MAAIIEGRVHKFGDDVDTDAIMPGRYLAIQEPAELAKHVFEGVDPEFVRRVQPGDILVAGRNFGSGSSREHAPLGLKALGLGCVVAASFARIFYRNAINLGLPIVISPEAAAAARDGDTMRVDTARGTVEVGGRSFACQPFPPFLQELIAAGGLVPWVRSEMEKVK
ncbi:MAG: 3-isopropylmalate dehydratase small subunit [Bacillota bacterium]|nr:3-isopropylmalate dehydratase small subunit [Bacillota bacterium]